MMLTVRGGLRALYDATTETVDVIDALYWALPKWARVAEMRANGSFVGGLKRPGVLEKAQAVYRHMGDMNWLAAMGNLVRNEVSDRAFGRIGRFTAQANRKAGRFHGFAFGPAL